MLQDFRFAMRTLRRQPGFTLVATLTLALGIGATTAIFTAVNAVLLSQLPFENADRLHAVRTEMTDGRVTGGAISTVEMLRLEALDDLVEQAGGTYQYEGSLVDGAGNPIKVPMQGVVGRFFEVMGTPIAKGRTFLEDELFAEGQPRAAIISHRAWSSWFNSDPDIIGRSVTLEGSLIEVVGVAEEGFSYPAGTDVWLALPSQATATGHNWAGVVRVRRGITSEQLDAALGPVSTGLQTEYPAANGGRVLATRPLRDEVVGPWARRCSSS